MNLPTRFFPILAIPMVSCLLVSCGDTSGTAPPEEEPPGPAAMVVSPEAITVDALGQEIQFVATVWDQLGRVLPDAPITWYTSDEKIATVSPNGLATTVGDGTVTILAAASSVFGWGEMTVTAKALAIVTFSIKPGVVGLHFSRFLKGEGSSAPLWTLTEGTLPEGLTLNPSTGEISGTPVTTGETLFTVQLTGTGHSVSRAFSIVIVREDLGIGFGEEQFALIPAGNFQMGSEDGEEDERPVHTVNITRPFMIQKTEVTQHQLTSIMGGNPSAFVNCGETCPVENVSWEGAQGFIQALNQADPGKNYRLPTEAEWEYAARAGTTGEYGGTGVLDEMGWYLENSGSRTHFVGQKEPNAWGLYDMHGNVAEWVQDFYSPTYYSESPTNDPQGPPTGDSGFPGYSIMCLRGGAVDGPADRAQSSRRGRTFNSRISATIGFRLVRDP